MAKQRFAGLWEHGCLGLLWRHNYEVVGSNNRSILYLGKQAESYKVMIYAPPCLEIDDCRRCSRSQTRNASENIRGSTQEVNTGTAIKGDVAITTKQSQTGKDQEATRDTALRYGSTVESGY